MSAILMFAIIFSGSLALFGVVFFIIGITLNNNRKRKEINCTLTTYGKVTDIVEHKSYNRKRGYLLSWHPVFSYSIGELKFIKESPYGGSQPKYAIGQDVEVYYNPADYNEYYIGGDTLPKTLATIFTVIGIVLIIIALFLVILIL